MKEKKNITKWIYWFSFAVAVIIVYNVLENFSAICDFLSSFIKILMPFIIAIIIAYLFYTPCKKIENLLKKNKYLKNKAIQISVITVYVVVILILIFIIKTAIPAIANSVLELAKSLPGYYNNILDYYDNLDSSSMLKSIDVYTIIDNLKQINIMDYISFSNVWNYVSSAIGVVSGIFSFFVSIIFSIYLLMYRHSIKNFFIKLVRAVFPKKTSKNIIDYVAKSNKIFLNFIYCQIIDAIIVGIIMSVILSLMKVKYSIILGPMIGLLNIIPYFGAIIGIAIATIITIFTGGIEQAIIMLIVTIVMQQIDSNIINPKILGDGLKINPMVIIFAVTIGGAYFNVLGMFLAVPVAAVLKIILEDYIEIKLKSRKSEEKTNKCETEKSNVEIQKNENKDNNKRKAKIKEKN